MPASPLGRLALLALAVMALLACAGGDDAGRRGESGAQGEPEARVETAQPGVEAGDSIRPSAGMATPEAKAEERMSMPSAEGVEGVVTVGPLCPVVEQGQECPDRPYSAALVIRAAASGEVVASVTSGSDGRFRVGLSPGDYVIEPAGPRLLEAPSAQPQPFSVEAGRYTRVELRFDTGMR